MHIHKALITSAFLFFILNVIAQTSPKNPLLIHSNAPVEFTKINSANIREASAEMIKRSDAHIKKIIAVAPKAHTVQNTLMAFDELFYDLTDLEAKLGVIGSTYSDDSTRNAANVEMDKLSLYSNNLYLNDGLYKTLIDFKSGNGAKNLPPNQKKFLKETILNFELNGMKLGKNERKTLRAINAKLVSLGTSFDRNIAESKDSVEFTFDELKGIPEATMAPWKRANGKYMVYVNGPNYIDIRNYAESDATRKTMYVHWDNRAYPKNIAVLDSLFFYRQKLADVLGFKSYADYALVTKMAANPTNVWNFENDLIKKLEPHVTTELKELSDLKHSLHPELPDTIYAWDVNYYNKKLLDTKYNLNTDEVRQYFEINHTVKGMFAVYEKLFNIKIKQTYGVPVWSPKVTSYEMFKDGKKIGSFYLDLYPRPNKYTHFECAPISLYRMANHKEVLPVSTLICNFPESTPERPSLLEHSDVVTMFHEFGHLVHSLLCHPQIAMQGAFFTKGDFVEAPSQFLENWCWEYEPLKLLARNYKTGAPLPESLFNKMKKAQLVDVAIFYIRQVYLGVLDFTYENKYDSIKKSGIMNVSKNLFAMRQIPFPEGTHFICSFPHLNGYGANYYGYLWSKVFAQDMFSVFQKNGVMNVPTGIRYRKDILEKGATMEEMDELRDFLGREPNNAAFLKSLGIE